MNDSKRIIATPVVPLRTQVETTLRHYFQHLGDYVPHNLYKFVLSEVEPPLLQVVLEHTDGNQSRAAEILGLDRGTLRKKLREHGLL
ncbi:MAG: helix-turn-helix domain-containing protein [Gammaproteobacteria bacterium]